MNEQTKKRSDLSAVSCRFEDSFYQRMRVMIAQKGEYHFKYCRTNLAVETFAELGLREYMEMQRRLGALRAGQIIERLVRCFESETDDWLGWSAEEAAANCASQLREEGKDVPAETPRQKYVPPRIIPFPAAQTG